MRARSTLLITLALALAACVTPIRQTTLETLNAPGIEGTRWGLLVTTLDGEEVLAINPDQRFLPASTTKLLTTAAAFRNLPDPRIPTPAFATALRLESRADGAPTDIAIIGGGDPAFSDAPDCETNCLEDLAEIIAAHGVTEVSDVIGDDTLFPDQRWGAGWSWEDFKFRYGTAVSALTVDNNVIHIDVRPGPAPGAPVIASWAEREDLYDLAIEAVTVEGLSDHLRIDRIPGSTAMRIHGNLGAAARPMQLTIGVDDPALFAALRLARHLTAKGVAITGEVRARHRPATLADEPVMRQQPVGGAQLTSTKTISASNSTQELARLLPPPLIEPLTTIAKDSDNLHAELVLRRLARLNGGTGGVGDGLVIIEQTMNEAAAPRTGWDIADGSGMSVYNRISPRALTRLLVWSAQQPWGAAWRDTFPIGGVDGTLEYRFAGSALEGRIFAKSGTLRGTNALAGYLLTATGETLAFAIFANDRPWDASSATVRMDTALIAIAEAR